MKKSFAISTATWLGGVALACFSLTGQAWAADMAPEAMVQKVAGETLAHIKADASLQTGDVSRIVALVDRNVMPHVNFTRLTGTAVGPAWRTATPVLSNWPTTKSSKYCPCAVTQTAMMCLCKPS